MDAYYFEITKGAFYIYVVLLLTAAVTDVWKFIIPNLVCLALVALFLVLAAAQPFPVDWWSHLGAMAAFFVVGLLLYRFKGLGAGDVKLITALCLWAGFSDLLLLLLAVALAGGALSVALIVIRHLIFSLAVSGGVSDQVTLPKVLLKGSPVPYGFGIAAGGIWHGTQNPLLGFL